MGQTLTLEERETIITFDETSADADLFTYNKAYQKHIEKTLGIKPYSINGFGGREYKLPKKWLRLPRGPRKLSPEVKAKQAERLAQIRARRQKSSNSAGALSADKKSPAKTGKGYKGTGGGKGGGAV